MSKHRITFALFGWIAFDFAFIIWLNDSDTLYCTLRNRWVSPNLLIPYCQLDLCFDNSILIIQWSKKNSLLHQISVLGQRLWSNLIFIEFRTASLLLHVIKCLKSARATCIMTSVPGGGSIKSTLYLEGWHTYWISHIYLTRCVISVNSLRSC